MKMFKATTCATIALIMLSGCASNDYSSKKVEESKIFNSIPDWVLNPVAANKLIATDCVKFSGNISIDQKMAVANARATLAQQIQTKVEAMDKTYARRTDTQQATDLGSTFESVTKQITNETLSGSRATKFGVATINNQEYYCALVTMGGDASKALFDKIIASSGRNLDAQEQGFLYEEFKAHKAQEGLQKEIERLTN